MCYTQVIHRLYTGYTQVKNKKNSFVEPFLKVNIDKMPLLIPFELFLWFRPPTRFVKKTCWDLKLYSGILLIPPSPFSQI